MGIISDSKGNMNFLDLGNVSLIEAVMSTGYFVAIAAVFSNFDVQIPTGSNSVITMAEQLYTVSLPILGTAVLELGITIATLLMLYQIIDASVNYGRSDAFEPRAWLNSIPAGLTVATLFVVGAHLSYVFQFAPVLDLITGGLLVEFAVISVSTAVYWAVSSQG